MANNDTPTSPGPAEQVAETSVPAPAREDGPPPPKVVAKFYVDSVERQSHRTYPHKTEDDQIDYQRPETGVLATIKMRPVSGTTPENREFWEASPVGRIELGILLEEAAEHFDLDASYYVTFERADD